MQDFVPILVLIAVVMLVAYVARRAQAVGLPPGISKDHQPDPGDVSAPAPLAV